MCENLCGSASLHFYSAFTLALFLLVCFILFSIIFNILSYFLFFDALSYFNEREKERVLSWVGRGWEVPGSS